MDLNALNPKHAAEAGATLHLAHPVTFEPLLTPDGKPITIDLLGDDSAAARDHQRRMKNDALQRMSSRRKNKQMTAGGLEEQEIEYLVALTTGWSNIYLEGKKVEFSADAARHLYRTQAWIAEQVDEFIGDRGNFSQVSAKT